LEQSWRDRAASFFNSTTNSNSRLPTVLRRGFIREEIMCTGKFICKFVASVVSMFGCSLLFAQAPTVAQKYNNSKNGMKLGAFVEFSLSVKDVAAAQKFYGNLGFKSTKAAPADYPTAAVTDGSVVLALHQVEFKSPTITYFGSAVAECLSTLQENNIDAKVLKRESGKAAEVEFADINGQRVVLKTQAPAQREGVSFEMMTPAGPKGKERHYSKCGIFGEFSIPVKDRAASAAFWQKLGFQKMFESDAPYPWGIYSDSVTVLGIHQTTEFKETALSFFSKDSKDRIASLKKEGFQFLVDLDPTNSVLKSPNGQMIFVFNLP
jgi:predicted lactoylglutathione lyase